MHRVELKGNSLFAVAVDFVEVFLMHRVELKVWLFFLLNTGFGGVPNAPCGVERPHHIALT